MSSNPFIDRASERVVPARSAMESGGGNVNRSRSELLSRLEKREAMLRATSLAAAQFGAAPWPDALDQALHALGEAVDVSRLWLVQLEKEGSPSFLRVWSGSFAQKKLEASNWDDPRWRALAASGQIVEVQEAAPGTKAGKSDAWLKSRDTLALVAAPIRVGGRVGGRVWGFLGFDECRGARVWDEAEIEALQLLADLIGAALSREQLSQALGESEAELRALFGAMRDAIFVVDRDGRYLKVMSHDPSLFFRPIDEMIGKTAEEVLGVGIGREFVGVVRDVLKAQTLRSLEYPLLIGGEDVWFAASVTPLGEDTVLWVARDVTPARRARESLRESEALFRLLAENSTDKIARMSMDGTFLYVSPSVRPLLGFDPEEIVGVNPFDMIHPDDRPIVLRVLTRIQDAPGVTDVMCYRMRRKSGEYIWFETTARVVFDASGQPNEIHSVSRDISERRAGEAALRDAEAKYRSIFENAVEGIFQSTPEGNYLDANPSLARIYGYASPQELRAQLFDITRQLYLDPRRRGDFIAEMEQNGAVANFEAQIRRKDDQIIWISENARSVRGDDGRLLYYEGTVEDITARKNAEGQLLHDALHDKLTGLSNRALFMDRLGQAFSRLKRHPEQPFATLFLDFDRFKNVNDSLGHMAGDELLIQVSRRISECLRPGDTVSRLGGDEFAILLEDIVDVGGAIMVAERIQEAMTAPFTITKQEVFTSASIGIAMGHLNYNHPEELLRDADMAMYRAKALGKARHHVFDAGMHKRAVALLQLETDLRHAIERNEFRIHYQPIVSLESGRIAGFEALVRWQHPQRGLVSPAEFIPVAEETGWIVPLGRHVLQVACRQLAHWHAQSGDNSLSMSVNLSSKQFAQPGLQLEIAAVLREHNLPASGLHLEITESAIMERAQEITDRLIELRAMGVKLGLDDFGTGYSSLSYLHRFPLDTLKIDRSFIANMGEEGKESGENREIVRTIVALGRNLGMNVVAEGIEDAAQLADLRALGCQSGQGYFFARPLEAGAALELIESAPTW